MESDTDPTRRSAGSYWTRTIRQAIAGARAEGIADRWIEPPSGPGVRVDPAPTGGAAAHQVPDHADGAVHPALSPVVDAVSRDRHDGGGTQAI